MTNLMKGKPVADAISEGLTSRIAELADRGITPTLALVRVGMREDDQAYERGIEKRFSALGIDLRVYLLTENCTQEQLMDVIDEVNADGSIHGCLLCRPLPAHLDEQAACMALDPVKDVDGITEGSLYGVFAGKDVGYPPCTAEACVQLLEYYGHDLSGANVVVIGRSLVIGKPVSMMLLAKHATVTMCHTRTHSLADICKHADIIVSAAGHAGTIGAEIIQPHHVIVDVGINWDEDQQRLVGDVAFEKVEARVNALTPVPGGVGSVTTAVLASHVVQAAQRICS